MWSSDGFRTVEIHLAAQESALAGRVVLVVLHETTEAEQGFLVKLLELKRCLPNAGNITRICLIFSFRLQVLFWLYYAFPLLA